jgi:ABC-type histidine transport system ATPase subunit
LATEPPATDGPRAIEFHDVYKSFGDNEVLKGIDLEVRQGETMVVLGSSGSANRSCAACSWACSSRTAVASWSRART